MKTIQGIVVTEIRQLIEVDVPEFTEEEDYAQFLIDQSNIGSLDSRVLVKVEKMRTVMEPIQPIRKRPEMHYFKSNN